MGKTRKIFETLQTLFEEEFAGDVDSVARFEDEPSLAVDSHIAEISGPTGSAILYGLAVEGVAQQGGGGSALSKNLSLSVIVVRRLGPQQVTAHAKDLAISDDLMDRAEALFEHSGTGRQTLIQETDVMNTRLTDRAPVPSGPELGWNARQINFDLIRSS